MPSPRNKFRYDESDPKTLLPFPLDLTSIAFEEAPARNSAWVDKVVKINSSGVVLKPADGDEIVGVLEQVYKDGRCRVQTKGLRVVPCKSAAAFTLNLRVVADDSGGVKPATGSGGTGRAFWKIDTTHVLVEF